MTVVRAFLAVCFLVAYLVAMLFYSVFKPHLSSWTVGYWTGAALLLALAPLVLSLVTGVV